MPAARDDYLLRLIQEAGAALRRFRTRLGGGDAPDDVSRDAGAAIGTLLGPQRPVLERLDAWSAANLLGDPERVQLWAELLLIQSDAERVSGRTANSDALATRSAELAKHGKPLAS